MALAQSVAFSLLLLGDGSSSTITITFATAVISFNPPSSGSFFGSGFDITTTHPAGVHDVACSGGIGVTSASIGMMGSTMTVNFDSSLDANTYYTVSGFLTF